MPKRIPGMYAFYARSIQEAYNEDNPEKAEYFIKDAPWAVYEALVRNEVIEVSVERSREGYEGDEPVQLELFN